MNLRRLLLALVALAMPALAYAQALPSGPRFQTPAANDNSTTGATTGYVDRAITNAKPPATVVNMLAYGADPTGATNSCGTALTNALAAIPSTGGTLYFPGGTGATYLCAGAIAVANKPIEVRGDGSRILFSSATSGQAGIVVSQNSFSFETKVVGLRIETSVAQTVNAGIKITYPTSSPIQKTVTIEDVSIDGGNANAFYWKYGVQCANCGLGVVSNFHIRGKDESNPPAGISASNMAAGFKFSGYTTDTRVSKGIVIFADVGAYVAGDSEGGHWTDVTMLAVNNGYFYDDKDTSGDATAIRAAPGPQIQGGHSATYRRGLVLKGWQQSMVNNHLFYKRPDSTLNWIGVELSPGLTGAVSDQANLNQIIGNHFVDTTNPTAGTAIGVAIGSTTSGVIVTSNLGTKLDWLIDYQGSPGVNVVGGNMGVSLRTAFGANTAGIGAITFGNSP